MSDSSSNSRRLIARNSRAPVEEDSSNRFRLSNSNHSLSNGKAKENGVSSLSTPSSQTAVQASQGVIVSQTGLMMNYINKEPFNEEVEIEETSLYGPGCEWRELVFENFRKLIDDLKQFQNNPGLDKVLVKEYYRKGLLLCGMIKKLNRVSNMRVNKARIKTHEDKLKIDEHHLELQNLLYEISHLKREINKCLQFSSAHEKINLVPIEEFYSKAPAEVSKPDVTQTNEHLQKLAELDWELIQRQSMTERIKDLEAQIEHHELQVKLRQNKLDSLLPKLNQILDACKPTLEYFETEFEDGCMFSEIVQYLPRPLFQFYMMINAYKDTHDKDLRVEINGDLEDAKRYNINEKINLDEDESDSENEEAEYKKKKAKKNSKKKANYKDKLFNKFPLSCKVTFSIKDYGEFSLEFFYYNLLKIVTVKSEIKVIKEVDGLSDKGENLFDCLYENDEGLESPNMSNKLLLNNMGIKSIESYIKSIGRPYKWCQIICGLYFENRDDRNKMIFADASESTTARVADATADDSMKSEDEENDDKENEENLTNVNKENEARVFEQIVARLKNRFKSRVTLQETLHSLRNLTIPSHQANKYRFKIQSRIQSFKESSYEKAASLKYAKLLLDSTAPLFTDERDCSFYELVLVNSNATLHAQIALNIQYPKIAPLFMIIINWKHERNSQNDEAVRDIEREINVLRDFALDDFLPGGSTNKSMKRSLSGVIKSGGSVVNEKGYDLLAKQINHLLVCFDVYLESESYYLNTHEYPRHKLFATAVRGRDRRRPYSYLADKDLFVQRLQLETESSHK